MWLVTCLSWSCTRDNTTATASGAADTPLIATALGTPLAPGATEFAGAARCQSCHVEQFRAWRASTHGTAGGPTAGTDRVPVIAPFDGTALRFRDATVIPRQRNATHISNAAGQCQTLFEQFYSHGIIFDVMRDTPQISEHPCCRPSMVQWARNAQRVFQHVAGLR